MTARDAVLAAARRLGATSLDGTFTVEDVLSPLREEGLSMRPRRSVRMCHHGCA